MDIKIFIMRQSIWTFNGDLYKQKATFTVDPCHVWPLFLRMKWTLEFLFVNCLAFEWNVRWTLLYKSFWKDALTKKRKIQDTWETIVILEILNALT